MTLLKGLQRSLLLYKNNALNRLIESRKKLKREKGDQQN